ncbi:hypothetical protein [Parageobacillus thermoglucosidasius]|jgi:hypothetical protein|uniref:hypothetical protein n=1 Tax=Parageobacillus thermoglucosidasius TaxID=1426 RepID=UPI001FCB6CEE|nr:hypothetical protein [Parageobacillus thermoglucosidasius]BDG30462.1 hypothetical protein PthBH41_01740 [Parageobacillus thermoglucosidasius]
MDLNILISTIIAATSALVAIIGGFLVSRVLSLSSERVGIERKLREIENDISAKKDMLERVNTALLEEDVNDFIKDNCKKILLEDKTLEQIIDEDEYTSLTVDQLKPYINEFNSIKKEVFTIINEFEGKTIPSDFNDLIQGRSELKKPERKEWYELIYETIYDLLPEEEEESSHHFGININDLIPRISFPTKNFVSPVTTQAMMQRRRDMENERNRLEDDIRILELQKQEQEKILGDYGKPKGLWGGLLVLIYSCIVGIAYPSTLLPYPSNVYNDTLTKWFLLGLFFSQLIALFIYLAVNLHRLTKTK